MTLREEAERIAKQLMRDCGCEGEPYHSGALVIEAMRIALKAAINVSGPNWRPILDLHNSLFDPNADDNPHPD